VTDQTPNPTSHQSAYKGTSIYESVFEVAREKAGSQLHDIVNSRATFVDEDVLLVRPAYNFVNRLLTPTWLKAQLSILPNW